MEKKSIKAEIIADSLNESGDRITTFVVTFPRIILAELNTHRVFSRNSASSRAIPFKKMVKMVREDPFIPIAWQKDHKGMQGTEYFNKPYDNEEISAWWLGARDKAVEFASSMNSFGLTKQLCNRLLEPFMWHTAIITATEFENFFKLRCPQYVDHYDNTYRSKKDFLKEVTSPDEIPTYGEVHDDPAIKWGWFMNNKGQGEIHIMALAEAMWDAYNESSPKQLKTGEWHIPFGDKIDSNKLADVLYGLNGESFLINAAILTQASIEVATARCARVSYLNFEGKDDYKSDFKLTHRLSQMGHWSPFEHCAQAMGVTPAPIIPSIKLDKIPDSIDVEKISELPKEPIILSQGDSKPSISVITPSTQWSGNFKGFIQYRKQFQGEDGK